LKEGGFNNIDRNYFDGVFTLKAKEFVKGLQLRAVYGANYRTDLIERFFRTVELWARLNPIRYINPTNRFDVTNGLTKNNNLQFLADYDFKLGAKNSFHILGGYQWDDSRITSVYTSVTGLVNNNVPSLSLGNQAGKVATDAVNTYAYQSVFGRANFSHGDKYLVEVTVRSDESSRLAPGQRVKIFPGASVAWNVHKEQWFSNALPFISVLKPRLNWGQLGSAIGIGNYSYLDLLTSNSNVVLGQPGARSTYFFQNTVASSSLTWETIESTNAGLELGLAKNKLYIELDYYTKYNRNMLTPLVLPSAFGIGAPRVNNGTLKSWGWEINANYNDKINKSFSYNVGFNLSDNQNKLVSYAGQKVIVPGFVGTLEGYPLNTLWGYQTDGYFQTKAEVTASAFQNTLTSAGDVKYRDLNGDGLINGGKGTPEDHGDLVNIGTTQPRFTFGFNAGMNWKGIDVSVFLQGVGKRTFYPNARGIQPMWARNEQINKIHLDYWTPENPDAAFPRPFAAGHHNFLPSDKWLLDGKYIRLKNLQVGYTLPTNWLQKVKISRARIFFSGQDILTFSGLGIFDQMLNPETKDTGNFGADYPFFGTATMGLNIGF
jgi:TonB-linked SusC/RagA family outer membrane protein